MRFNAVVTAAVMPAVFFGVSGVKPVHAQTQKTELKPKIVVNQVKKPVQPRFVTVQPGDYLEKIAKDNRTTYPRLYNANPKIKDPDLIYPGQKIKIPPANEKVASRSISESQPAKTTTPTPVASPRAVSNVQPPIQHVQYTMPANASVWDRIAQCESGGNWSINTGNGFYGGLQFTLSSWRAVGGSGYPNQASKAEQITRAQILQSRQGWGAWPACTAKLGIR